MADHISKEEFERILEEIEPISQGTLQLLIDNVPGDTYMDDVIAGMCVALSWMASDIYGRKMSLDETYVRSILNVRNRLFQD